MEQRDQSNRHLDDQQRLNIRLLDRFYNVFAAILMIFLVIGVPFVFHRKLVSAALCLSLLGMIFITRRISRAGNPQKSLLMFAVAIGGVLILLLYGGLPPVSSAIAIAVAVILAVVVNMRAGVLFGVVYLIAWLSYVILDASGQAPAIYFPGSPVASFLIGALGIWLVLLPIPPLVNRVRAALVQARDASAKLEESLAFNTAIVLASPVATGVYAAHGPCVLANDAYAGLVGATREELQAQNFRQLNSWEESGLLDVCLEALSSDESRRQEIHVTSNFNKEVWLDCQVLPLTLNGTPHLLMQFHDLTEVRQVADAMKQAKEAAEAANLAKSRFLATMSHEIRTPMNGILGMAQLLLMPTLNEEERYEYARTVFDSGQMLLALLNDILDFSKIETGRFELESTTFDPRQIVNETQSLFAATAAEKGLRLVADCSGIGATHYLGDPYRLRQMLSNLVSNAIKFTTEGEIRIDARETERSATESVLEFSVTDTGIGISAAQQRLLFQPFSQADSSTTRVYGGSGLGLSIVSRLARLMGGDVGVDSSQGKGSHFWFRVRARLVAEGDAPRRQVIQPNEGDTAPPTAQFPHRILVVEDNPTNRKVVTTMLEKLGVTVTVAEHGQEAVAAVTEGTPPDLVFMDCQMPVMDGYEATRRIRRWEAEGSRPRLPIVALTAGAFQEDRDLCRAAGMDDFLTKPLAMDTLTAMLRRWLSADRTGANPAPRASEEAQGGAHQVFDEEALLSRLGGDREFAKAIVLSALDDIPDCFGKLEKAIAAGDWKEAKMATHTMKGLAAQTGGTELARRFREADDRLKRGSDIDDITLAELRTEYQRFQIALQAWLQR